MRTAILLGTSYHQGSCFGCLCSFELLFASQCPKKLRRWDRSISEAPRSTTCGCGCWFLLAIGSEKHLKLSGLRVDGTIPPKKWFTWTIMDPPTANMVRTGLCLLYPTIAYSESHYRWPKKFQQHCSRKKQAEL